MATRRFYSEDLSFFGYRQVNEITQNQDTGRYEIIIDLAGKLNSYWIIPPQTFVETINDPETGTETTTTTKSIEVDLVLLNGIENFSQGKIILTQGETKVILNFPINSIGKFEIGEQTTNLSFVYTSNGYVWGSDIDSTTYSLAANSAIDLYVDPISGINDQNHLTPYLTINHCIREIKRLIPYTTRPEQTSGYGGDRFIGVNVRLMPGTYALTPNEYDGDGNPIQSETVFAQYLSSYGISFIGQGTTPNDVIIYGNDANDGIKISNSCEINFENLTISSNRSGIYVLDSNDINVLNCIFINRSNNVRNAIFSLNSRLVLKGVVELRGQFRRLVNCNRHSIAEISAEIIVTPSAENPKPFEGFLSAFTASDIYASQMTVPGGVPQGGIALVLDSPKCTIEMPTDIGGLTYP